MIFSWKRALFAIRFSSLFLSKGFASSKGSSSYSLLTLLEPSESTPFRERKTRNKFFATTTRSRHSSTLFKFSLEIEHMRLFTQRKAQENNDLRQNADNESCDEDRG